MNGLRLSGVSLRQAGLPVMRDLELTLHCGQITALLGPNGAGKTSALRLASGEWQPSAGQVELFGRALRDWPARERACRLAVLPQQSSLSFGFTAREVIALGRQPHASGRTRDESCIDAAMRVFDLKDLAAQLYPLLSGGERQRVQLARVLAQVWPCAGEPPGVVLLDEPTAGLDWSHQLALMQALRDLAGQGLAVGLVLHDLNLALRFADQAAVLSDGELVAVGAPSQVLDAELIRRVFGVDTWRIAHPDGGWPVVLA